MSVLAPVHPGPEDGHETARRRRERGEALQADGQVRGQHLGLPRRTTLWHAGNVS